jgi:antirestriction protein ArdC
MICTVFTAEKFQIGAGLSGYRVELGAAFLCSDLGISQTPREDHACYIANWLQVLKSDKKAVFTAASKASEAANWLIVRQAAP